MHIYIYIYIYIYIKKRFISKCIDLENEWKVSYFYYLFNIKHPVLHHESVLLVCNANAAAHTAQNQAISTKLQSNTANYASM